MSVHIGQPHLTEPQTEFAEALSDQRMDSQRLSENWKSMDPFERLCAIEALARSHVTEQKSSDCVTSDLVVIG